ncbi:MAG TPA: hypothetical protein VJS19_05050 [Candidatus Dormibacteraeota bacterium]|nr:hypothetical protein [Candidatus Dormibacteraeota bacterium]
MVFSQEGTVTLETVHLLTYGGRTVVDCLLFDRQPIYVWDAAHGVVLLSTTDGTLWTFDLRTESLRNVGYSRGDLLGPVLSPDGTQAVLESGPDDSGWAIKIVDLDSGASRIIRQVGPNEYFRAGLVPLRWLQGGILLTPGVLDCGFSGGILKLDPVTGGLAPVSNGEVGVLSQSGASHAYSDYSNLADANYLGECGWHNTLFTSALGAQPTLIREQANRDFDARDVREDGSVLYISDDAPGSDAAPAPDMGLYLYAGGVSYKQFGEDRIGEWQSAVFVGPDAAIATEQLSNGPNGSAEVILVTLCRSSSCHATATAIDNPTGPDPYVRLVSVRP